MFLQRYFYTTTVVSLTMIAPVFNRMTKNMFPALLGRRERLEMTKVLSMVEKPHYKSGVLALF
jgi:hypothetical protein